MKINHDRMAPVCIAGAHRSGTSMLARLLRSAGLSLGPAGDMMPAQEDNPDGFWENLRFVAINDEVLNELGGAWDLPPPSHEDFGAERLEPLRLKARVLIESFADGPLWGWKDPRNSLTLPFWEGLLPSLKTIVMVRNPLEVAYSMHKRNGTSYAFGLRLWELYNRRIIAATNASRRLLTSYNEFFNNPERELRRIAAFIGLPENKIEETTSLIARNRRHTSFTVNQLVDARISPEIIELYRAMTSGEPIPFAETKVAVPDGSNGLGKPVADLLPGEPNRLRLSVPEGEEIRQELALLRGMKLEHEQLCADLPRLRETARQDGRIRELQDALAQKDREIGEAAERFTLRTAELGAVQERLARTDELLRSRTERLRQQLNATLQLTQFLASFRSATARLRASRRWKMANPFAALRGVFTGRPIPGYGDLEGTASSYETWKSIHPEVTGSDEALRDLAGKDTLLELSVSAPRTPWPRIPSRPISFQVHDEVEISIIIPVFNHLALTQSCLASIQENAGAEAFEVIVVDDGSTDATRKEIPKIPGVVYLRDETNGGFITACNLGAARARGEFLVFLNNDTEVTTGWLSALRETFALNADAGLVGSKLLFPDGRLQEAGGIIWRDGTGWNYGKFDNPAKPEYNFMREVDYCSGASIMVPKAIFEKVGRFDPNLVPAYYEDADLAFKVRRAGYKVLYQPLSEVIHAEGATAGTDLNAGAKKHQEINRNTFMATWADVLANKAPAGDIAAHHALEPGKKRILVVDHHVPTPDRDAGSLRMFHIITSLRELGHRVTFIGDNLVDIPPYGAELQKRGIEFVVYPHVADLCDYLKKHGAELDVVILSRSEFAQKHIANVRALAPQSRVIFDTVDLHFLRQTRQADVLDDPEERRRATERQNLEYGLIDQADETWVVSDFELELLRRTSPNNSIEIVSMIVEVEKTTTPFSLRRDFLFIGSFQHPPNADAAIYFAREIFPHVRARLPEAKFVVIGDKAPPEVLALACDHVVIAGYVPDVRPYFDQVKMSVAPLRWGAGVKGKINQSMGLGVPVVATSLAAEGMALTNRRDILIADGSEEFAAAMIELYQSEDLWTQLSENGLTKTQEMYSCAAAKKKLSQLLGKRDFASATSIAHNGR